MNDEKKLEEHIKEICIDLGYKFIEASIHGHKNKQNIKIIADTEEGITLQECKKLSREISDIIFRKDLIYSDYRLDVSSPGLDKALQHGYEYERNIGRELIVIYEDEDGNSKEVIGELTEHKNDEIILSLKDEQLSLKMKNINKAKIKLKW
jgi:ribosome maturation factor RimP